MSPVKLHPALSRCCQGISTALTMGLLGFASPAAAQEMQIESSVQVAMQEDATKTRNQALAEAMRQALDLAVEQAAPEVRGRTYLLGARARDFVSSYRIVEESELDGRLVLKIMAQVDVAQVLKELQAGLPKSKRGDGRAKVLVCVQLTGADALASVLATDAKDLLTQRGQLVELGTMDQCRATSSWAGPRLGFVGNVAAPQVEVRGTSPRLWSAQLKGAWQYVPDASAAPQTEAGEGSGFAEKPEAALGLAVAQLGRPLLGKLADRSGLLGRVGGGVLLLTTGLRTPQVMNKLWKALAALPGVTRVEPRRIVLADGGDEQVHFQLTTTATTETLGAALYRTPIAGLRVQVVPLGPSMLRLDCVSAQDLPSASPEPQSNPTESPAP